MGNTSGGSYNDKNHFCFCMIDEDNNNNETNAKWINCQGCKSWFHIKCVLLTDEDYENIIEKRLKWYCNFNQCEIEPPTTNIVTLNTLPSLSLIQCTQCNFIAKNDRGLKVHQRKHVRSDDVSSLGSFEYGQC